jgi:hypothetical protein
MPSNTPIVYLETAACFGLRPSSGHQHYFKNKVKMEYTYIHHMVFTLWNPASLQCLLQCKIVKFGRTVADGCNIVVGLGKMYNDKIKMLNCKIKLIYIACVCIKIHWLPDIK